jgi:hypothetical protein
MPTTTCIKDDPQTTVLIDKFLSIMRTFQDPGTSIVKQYVELEYTSFRKQLLTMIIKGRLFCLSK